MEVAKDKWSGEEIAASDAVSGRYYACPACGEDVYLRRGVIRSRHFAHRSGRADPDCEKYHPGTIALNPLTASSERPNIEGEQPRIFIKSLRLGIQVEAASSAIRNRRRRWNLVLTIPQSATTVGMVRVSTGFSEKKRMIPLKSLSKAPKNIPVNPNVPSYRPDWISDEVEFYYRQTISRPIEGLDAMQVYAFIATSAETKEPSTVLLWGESYYLIWRRPDIVLPESLSAEPLATLEGWSAALVTLPPVPDDEVLNSLISKSHLHFRTTRRHWGILYPAPIHIDVSGNIVLPANQNTILVFNDAGSGEDEPSRLALHIGDHTFETITTIGAAKIIQVIINEPGAANFLGLEWACQTLPGIIFRHGIAGAALPEVIIQVRDIVTGEIRRTPFHDPVAWYELDLVAGSRAEMIGMTIPFGIVGRLRWRQDDGSWEQTVEFKEDNGSTFSSEEWKLSDKQLDILKAALRDTEKVIDLSFSAFGNYSRLAEASRSFAKLTLSVDMRRRLFWYFVANGAERQYEAVRHLSDHQLVDIFDGIVPKQRFIGLRNALRKQLVKFRFREFQ